MLAAIREQNAYARTMVEIESLSAAAFTPTDTHAYRSPEVRHRILAKRALKARRVEAHSLSRAAAQVAARLDALNKAHRLANSTEVLAPAGADATLSCGQQRPNPSHSPSRCR